MKKMQSLLVVLLVFSLVWVSFLQVGDVKAQSTVYIRNDGTIEGTDKIQQNEDTYTFTGDITGAVVLEKGGIVIEGDGYTLTGDGGSDGFYWDNVDGVTIKDVRVENCDNGFSISSSDNNTITGNTVTGNNIGIQIRFSKNNQITENSVLNNNQTGITLYRVENCTITNNTVTDNGGNGVESGSSFDSCVVSDNEIANNGADGFKMEWASNTTVTGNIIQDNTENGLAVYESRNNTISKNIISNNKADGIYLQTYTFENMIFLNNITSNSGYGINCNQYSAVNLIHHNNFIDNGNQTTTYSGETNMRGWDNDFPSGGNYWSDYNGADDNSDGIGDTPYIIDENNQDNYPLMSPVDINTTKQFSTIPEFPAWSLLVMGLFVVVALSVIYRRDIARGNTK